MGTVVDLDSRRPHRICKEACGCGHECFGVMPSGCDLNRLECGKCHQMTARAVAMLVSFPDEPDRWLTLHTDANVVIEGDEAFIEINGHGVFLTRDRLHDFVAALTVQSPGVSAS